MPELPEVESLRIGLERKIVNQKIISVEILKPKIVSGSGTKRVASKSKARSFENNLRNRKIKEIKRIAKNLIFILDKGIIVAHLKMTGQFVYIDKLNQKTYGGHLILESLKEKLPNKHSAIIFNLNNGKLYYNDLRMFGYVLYYKSLRDFQKEKSFQKLGLEYTDPKFTIQYFTNSLNKSNKTLKGLLLDQSVVTGCGNIYADEICFASYVLPFRKASSLNRKEVSLIYKNLKKILSSAISHGGSSINNYRLIDGSKGDYTKYHKVYKKYGLPCPRDRHILKKKIVAGRTTTYCEYCQK